MSSVFGWPAVAGTLLIIYIVGSILNNILFHPLSKYPGPLFAKITGWYEYLGVAEGEHHIWLYNLHQQYGPVVRVAPNRLSYNTVEALRSIYADRKANVKKAGFTEALALLKGGARNLQTINDRHTYHVRRRLISHAFSEEALRSSEQFIIDRIRDWCLILQSKAETPSTWTKPIDMKLWTYLLTQDILGELCFGQSFGVCASGKTDLDKLVEDGAGQAAKLCYMPLGSDVLRLIGKIAAYGMKREWAALKPQLNFDASINSMVQQRWTLDDDSRKDFFHYIVQAKDLETGETISPTEINREAGVLFGAGVDTSATCIAACLFYLTHYPEVLARLTSEIRTTFADVEEIVSGPQLKSLVYLRACIDETLRCSPPVPGPLLRKVMAGGIQIGDDFVPAGVEVGVPIYTVHNNELYFPDPFTFKPERWLDEDSGQANREAFHAFSAGLRVCIGRNLAYLDIQLALARLLFLFDVRDAEGVTANGLLNGKSPKGVGSTGGRVEYKMKDWFITARVGPVIQLRAREY